MISPGDMPPDDPPYTAAHIRRTVWGTFRHLDDGTWETVWQLVFATPADRGSPVEVLRDEEIGFSATFQPHSPTTADLLMITWEHAMAAEYYAATFKTFGLIAETHGTIHTIQQRPATWYAPFR